MKLQVLAAAVNQEPETLAEKMNLETEAVIVNQCGRYDYREYLHKDRLIRCFSMTERGVGLSRNTALLHAEGEICLMAVGSMVKTAEEVKALLNESGHKCSIINARFVKPVDREAAEWAAKNHKLVVSMEENVASGGYGEKLREIMAPYYRTVKFIQIAIPDEYVEHGNVEQLKKEIGIDAGTIAEKIKKEMETER